MNLQTPEILSGISKSIFQDSAKMTGCNKCIPKDKLGFFALKKLIVQKYKMITGFSCLKKKVTGVLCVPTTYCLMVDGGFLITTYNGMNINSYISYLVSLTP